MKIKISKLFLLLILICGIAGTATAQKPAAKKPVNAAASVTKTDKEELDAAIALPTAQRIEKLKAFIDAHPRSSLKTRAMELIVSAHAALGDEKLIAGDAAGGVEQFRLAVAAIPTVLSSKLFSEIVSQIPSNLFLRGQQAASLEVARLIEDRVKTDPMRLLTMTAFYLGIEAADDAIRSAELAVKLAPEMSAAYQARASARRMALRLDESAADYARALELEPKADGAKRSLAELRRATGKTEEALKLYRELLTGNPADEFARTGLVLSLFELGRKEEAEREFASALREMPKSLALLTGAAYWFAAHNDSARAIEFAQKAVELEPRYTWSHIAFARGLLQQKRAVDAERPLLLARQYGRFPTLDYEMATVLAAAGYYGEAAATLSSSFALKQDLIETYLAGRTLAQASTFTELLAPERRASIFQYTAADNEASARNLKALLTFSTLLNSSDGIKEASVLAAARDFVAGDDEMRAFRRLYVANRLLESNVGLQAVLEMMDAVTSDVDMAVKSPTASVAVMAEELRSARAQANAYGRTVSVPDIPRNTLSNIIRGRLEDLAGWALFHQGNFAEAIVRLRRAKSVLPENSIWWRNSMWHLGASLDASGKPTEALDAYYLSYKTGGPDPTRRAVIEGLYRRVNGSLDGLDAKIGPSSVIASNAIATPETPVATQNSGPENSGAVKTDDSKPVETVPTNDKPVEQKVEPAETKPPETAAASDKSVEQKVEPPVIKPAETSAANETPVEKKIEPTEPKPEVITSPPDATSQPKSETVTPQPPSTEPSPEPTPVNVPSGPQQPADNNEPPVVKAPATASVETKTAPAVVESPKERPRRVDDSKCTIAISESALTIQNNGGRAIIDVTLNGSSSTTDVTAATSDWSSIAVFPEPRKDASANSLSFSVSSISKKTGAFTVTFKTPCGSKDVIVTVR